jgi:GAF domain-containing protein
MAKPLRGAERGGKAEAYEALREQLRRLLDPSPGFLAGMATTAALLRGTFAHFFWVGFYVPAEDGSLVVGPYQGPLACLKLPPGKGVCGAAAKAGRTILVPDVHAFPGHIACDPRARSEIVVPVIHDKRLKAVLDVDCAEPNAFDLIDQVGLEELVRILAPV